MNCKRLLQLISKTALTVMMVVVFTASSVLAQSTWYVSTGGSDTFDGTSPNVSAGLVGPFLTMAAALTAASAGDTIVIEAGIYPADVTFTFDITIQATVAGGGLAVVTLGDGANPDLTFGDDSTDDITLAGGGATITTAGGAIDFDDGTVAHTAGALTVPAGGAVLVTEGTVSGAAVTYAGTSPVTYDGAGASSRTAGFEMPAAVAALTISTGGTGTLTFPAGVAAAAIAHTGASDVVFQSAVTASGLVSSTGTGDLAFEGGLTSSFATNPSVSVVDGAFTATDVTVDDFGGLFVAATKSAAISGTLTIQVDADNGPAALIPIDNDGTLTVGSIGFTAVDTDPGAAGDDVNAMTIDNDGDLTVGTLTEMTTTANTNPGAVAGEVISAPVTISNDTALSRFTFTNAVTLNGAVTNTVVAPDGIFFNGGGTLAADFNNDGAVTIATGQTLELTADGGVVRDVSDINGAGTLLISGDTDVSATIDSDGNVTISGDANVAAAATVDGNLTVTGVADFAAAVTVGGDLSVAADDVDFAAGVTVSGNSTLDGSTAAGDGPDIIGAYGVTGTATFNGTSTVGGGFTAGNATVNDDTDLSSGASTHNISGTLLVNGTADFSMGTGAVVLSDSLIGGSTLTVGSTIVAPTASLTIGIENNFVSQGDFTGGTIFGVGTDTRMTFDLPSGSSTFTPGPNSTINDFRVTGNERTLVLAQSFAVADDFFVADDATFDLTNRLVRMTAAANGTGLVEVATDANITATLNTGAISFEGPAGAGIFTISSDVGGQDVGTLTNLVVNMTPAGTATSVTIDEDVTITGVVSLAEGGISLAGGVVATFSGDDAGISINVAGAATAITGAGATAGVYDLTYFGAGAAAAGPEFVDPGTNVIDDLTVSTVGGVMTLGAAVGINGDFTVGALSNAALTGGLTIGGNVAVNATDASDGVVTGATMMLIGVGATHTFDGNTDALVWFDVDATATGTTTDLRESSLAAVTVDTGAEVAISGLQEITGALTVRGSLTLSLTDADAGTDDQDVEGAIFVDEGGTLILGSNIGAPFAAVDFGDAGAGSANLDLGGNTLLVATGPFTADADASLGTTGLVQLIGGSDVGTDMTGSGTPADIWNLNIDAVLTAFLSDVGVAGTLDVDEDFTIGTFDLWLSGDATFVDDTGANVDIIGTTGRFMATGTTLTMSEDTFVPNFGLNSTGVASLISASTTVTYDFVVLDDGTGVGEAQFDAGTLDLGPRTTFELRSTDGTSESLFDYNGGTVTSSGGVFVVNDDTADDGGGADFDFAGTGGALTIPILTINIGGAAVADATDGLDIGNSDVLTIGTQLNLTGGTLFTNDGTTDASVVFADGSRIVRNLGVLEQVPTFGMDMGIEYDAAVTTGNELAPVFDELQLDAAIILADDVDITINTLDINIAGSDLDVDADDGSVVTITDNGTVEIGPYGAASSFTTGAGAAGSDDGEITYAGAYNLLFDGTATADGILWAGTPATVTVSGGGGVTATLGASRTAQDVTIGAGETLAIGGNTLTMLGDLTQNGAITSGAGGTLSFSGAAAQTYNVPAAGAALPNVTINNTAGGVALSGGNLTVTATSPGGLILTSGVFTTGANILILTHGGTGVQGFTRTGGNVFGNVRKFIDTVGPIGGFVPAPADRMTYPVGTAGGDYRPASFTFNDPNEISGGAGTLSMTVTHVESSPGGNNGMPLTTLDNLGADLKIARYPALYWQATMSNTLSPFVSYDVELNAAGFTEFAGEDIERTRTIRRQAGLVTNFWSLVGSTAASNDNFALTATNPITVVRGAEGALRQEGVFFTMGLESNLTSAAIAAQSVNVGNTVKVDVSSTFAGGTGAYAYTVTSDSPTIATGTVTGDSLAITGVGTGVTMLKVKVTDTLNDTDSSMVSITVNPALAAAAMADVTLNVGGSNATSTTDLSTVFTGGSAPITYVVTSSDDAVATGAEATGTLTVTAVAAGSATITVVGTDATGAIAEATVSTTVNAVLAGSAIPDQELKEGESITPLDLSTVFSGGDSTYTYVVSTDAAHIDASESGGVLTATVVEAYAGGTTIGTVDVDVVATDGVGDSVMATLTIDVLPAPGDLSGTGGPSPANANITLNHYLSLIAPPGLTAKQVVAADLSGANGVTPYDAALNFAAWLAGKNEVVANIAGYLEFGEVVQDGDFFEIPIRVSGNDLDAVVSASFSAQFDPAFVAVQGVESDLGDQWIVKHAIDDEGLLRIGIAGYGDITSDGTLATIKLKLIQRGGESVLSAEGAVNENPVAKLDEIEIVELPETFTLQGNYPNPFNPSTTVQFDLPESAEVEIQIFDMLGRRAMVIPAQSIEAGVNRSIQVNASALASGSYFYRVIARMDSKTLVESGRMMLIK